MSESGKSGRGGVPVIGLVGGIGAGKSTVAGEFAALGCAVVDGDVIGHELYAVPAVRRQLAERFGDEILGPGGEVDRRALGNRVFGRPAELAALNAIMHPLIRQRLEMGIAQLQADASLPAIVLDAAVMIEAGWDDLCTHMIFVRASDDDRVRRVQESRGWEPGAWRTREKSQIPLDIKERHCYCSIDNSSSVSCLRERVHQVLSKIVQSVDRPQRP